MDNNTIVVSATPSGSAYTVSASLEYLTETDDELIAMIAVYKDNKLVGIEMKTIKPSANTTGH